jgi:hypothetical protein
MVLAASTAVAVAAASMAVVVAAVAIAKKEVKYGGGRFLVRRLFVCGRVQTLAKAALLLELEAMLCLHSQDSHPSPDFVTLLFRT